MTENLSHNNWYPNQYSNQAPPVYKRKLSLQPAWSVLPEQNCPGLL